MKRGLNLIFPHVYQGFRQAKMIWRFDFRFKPIFATACTQLPQKVLLASEVVKSDPKILISQS